MSHTTKSDDVEAIARCLAKEEQGRIDKKRGFTETDDLTEALGWLGYVKDAERLSQQGAKVISGKLII